MSRSFVKFKPLVTLLPLCLVLAVPMATSQANAGNYEFMAAPEVTLNRVYRIDRSTGQVGACQYGLRDETQGETLCYPSGKGAEAQGPGEYGLVASRHVKESGVFRVNKRDGQMSICFVLEDKVVCTPAG